MARPVGARKIEAPGLINVKWARPIPGPRPLPRRWRRRESNPRPEDSIAGAYRLIRFFPLAGRSSNRQGLRPASPWDLRRPSGAPGRRTPTLSHPIRPRRRWVRSSGSPHRGTVPSRWLRRPAGEPRNRGWHLLFARVVHGVRAAPTCHRRSASPVEPSSPPCAFLLYRMSSFLETTQGFSKILPIQTGGGGRRWGDTPRSPPAGGFCPLHPSISQNIEKPWKLLLHPVQGFPILCCIRDRTVCFPTGALSVPLPRESPARKRIPPDGGTTEKRRGDMSPQPALCI